MRRVRTAAAVLLVGCGALAVAITSTGAPSSASAAPTPPTATTGPPSNIGRSSATVTGTVNPDGQATSYYFRYGTTTSYGLRTSPIDAGSGTTPLAVHTTLAGLAAGTAYHYQLVAQSASGTSAGTDHTFTTTSSPSPPTATTGPPSGVGQSSAAVTGTINPNGEATSYYFRYGTTTSYGLQTGPAGAGSGTRPLAVHATLAGLAANTAYHYQLVAQNARGTSSGVDQAFTTTSSPSQAVVLGHEGFVSPGRIVGAEVGCFHGTSLCTGHLTMSHNGTVIAQRDYSIAPDSGGFQNMELNPAGVAELGQNGLFHLLPVTVTATASTGQSVSWVIHLARWVWH